MDFQTARLFFALLAVAANAATIGIVVIGIAGRFDGSGAQVRDRMLASFRGLELWLAFSIATTATLGSLYLSEVLGTLKRFSCLLFLMSASTAVSAAPTAINTPLSRAPLDDTSHFGIGATTSIYHRVIQAVPDLGGSACSSGAPCTAAYFTLFGFVTIPYMAFSAFALILTVLWIDRTSSAGHRPSLPDA